MSDSANLIATANAPLQLRAGESWLFPALILREGDAAARAYLNFFTAEIENDNTRAAYTKAVGQFLGWCELRGVSLKQVEPWMVATYIKGHPGKPDTVKQHLAAIRRLFDHLQVARIVDSNPAAPVRGPKHSVSKGSTPILNGGDAYHLLSSIETDALKGLRDKALMGVMLYSFARVSATLEMKVKDYFQTGRGEMSLRLREKGGKAHEVVVHHMAQRHLDAYLEAAGIEGEKDTPLFRSMTKSHTFSANGLSRANALKMIKARAMAAGLPEGLSPHSLRGTGGHHQLLGERRVARGSATHRGP